TLQAIQWLPHLSGWWVHRAAKCRALALMLGLTTRGASCPLISQQTPRCHVTKGVRGWLPPVAISSTRLGLRWPAASVQARSLVAVGCLAVPTRVGNRPVVGPVHQAQQPLHHKCCHGCHKALLALGV